MMNWLTHFSNRPQLGLDQFKEERISRQEFGRIGYSIAQFQRGESSEAKDYLEKSRWFSEESGQADFLEVSRLFVKEENYHSHLLDTFMAQMGIERLSESWADDVFRWVRSWGDIGWCSRVLLTAEILAQVYYPALREATSSRMLHTICDRIIADEDLHILFQTERIAFVLQHRSNLSRMVQSLAGWGLFWGTAVVVWFEHRCVLASSFSFLDYLKESFGRYQFAMARLNQPMDRQATLSFE